MYKQLNSELEDELAITYNRLEDARRELAREIFEEIAQIKKEYASGDIDGDTLYVRLHLLEKKYTEATP